MRPDPIDAKGEFIRPGDVIMHASLYYEARYFIYLGVGDMVEAHLHNVHLLLAAEGRVEWAHDPKNFLLVSTLHATEEDEHVC